LLSPAAVDSWINDLVPNKTRRVIAECRVVVRGDPLTSRTTGHSFNIVNIGVLLGGTYNLVDPGTLDTALPDETAP
jgi:hypothetical protein